MRGVGEARAWGRRLPEARLAAWMQVDTVEGGRIGQSQADHQTQHERGTIGTWTAHTVAARSGTSDRH